MLYHLKELRTERNLSQSVVASALGISQQAYANYESGKREADYDMLLRIAKYFECSADYLLGISDEKTPSAEASTEDVKVALFGGDGDVTDEMWAEVTSFVEFVKQKHKKDKDKKE
jgi:transcriptional regulator with XRE-family HTH domain